MFRLLRLSLIPVLATLIAAQAQTRKPSTPEDRAKAVELARSLENDPLGKQAKKQRAWLVEWLVAVPDLNVKVCANLLDPLLKSKKNHSAEIFTQMIASAAAFIIQNPGKAVDDVAVYTAAVEGSLRTYESILKTNPKERWAFLDELIEKRDKDTLKDYVSNQAPHCK